MKWISNKLLQGAQTMIIFWIFLLAIHQNLENLAQLFLVSIHVHSCHPGFKTDDKKQFQYLNIALSYKTGPLFSEFNVCKKKFFIAFKKDSKHLDNIP